MSIDFIYGSMRINLMTENNAFNLLRYIISKGCREFHVSYEYESFNFFRYCILNALKKEKVSPNEIRYFVKLSSPNFNEKEIFIDIYLSFLFFSF